MTRSGRSPFSAAWLAFAVILVPALARAGEVLDTTDQYEEMRGCVRLIVHASAVSGGVVADANGKVSGTNVESGFGASHIVETMPPNPGPTLITGADLLSYTVSIGGTTLFTVEKPAPGPKPKPWPVGANVRWASTHFADETSVAVKIVATYRLQEYQHAGTNIWSGTTTVEGTRTVEAYNKLQLLGTGVTETGAASTIFVGASDKATTAAKDALNPSHPSDPNVPSLARSEAAVDILFRAERATVMAALAHGSLDGFNSSNLSEFIYFVPEIEYTVGLRSVPPYNLAAFWSCKTLIEGAEDYSDSVTAYDIGPFDVDRAYAGFNFSPSIALWSKSVWDNGTPTLTNPQDGTLGDHAETFWTFMALGHTVAYALFKANEAYPPIKGATFPVDSEDMIFVGDPRTNLINVYLTQAEHDALVAANEPTDIWWIKLS